MFSFTYTYLKSQNDYLVLCSIADTNDSYYQAALLLKNYRNGSLLFFSTNNLPLLQSQLTQVKPRYVALVMRPEEIDINFVRRFFMLSTYIDPDPFTDFSYGFITGATGQDAINFVQNIIMAETNHIELYPLHIGGYVASSLNFVFQSTGDFLQYLNPPVTNIIYLETNDNNIGRTYFLQNAYLIENCKLLDIGHNGDPHMLWLFQGGNINPNPPIWSYDSTKIENPQFARAGLTSYDIATLNLYPAVAFNGACHSGEPKRVMVEDDIAATFGNTNGITQFYTMSDTFSFCLSILKTGITGYFAPCGANNANDQAEDVYHAFLYNEPLGDIHKRSNDGVVMGFFGNRPNFKLYYQGQYNYGCDILSSGSFNPSQWSGACYMLGGKANRIYFGDPMFNPFSNNHSPSLNITQYTLEWNKNNSVIVHLQFNKPDATTAYFPVWDKFHFGNTRIYIPVELPNYVVGIQNMQVISASGYYDTAFFAFETFDNKSILHIETAIPNNMFDAIHFNISFLVEFTTTQLTSFQNNESFIKLYPNPVNNKAIIVFYNNVPQKIQCNILDITGKTVVLYEQFFYEGNQMIHIHTEQLENGIYFLTLSSNEYHKTIKFIKSN